MSRLVYALSGEGRGHTSRALAVASELRRRGHQVRFCCGGVARSVLEYRKEPVIPVPPLNHVLDGNELQIWRTIRKNGPEVARSCATIGRLCDAFRTCDPALVVTDFEAFSARAAEHLGIPLLSLNHQQLITEAEYSIPPEQWLDAAVAQLTTHLIAPWRPVHVLLTSFFDLPLKHPDRVTLIPPIVREDVRDLNPVAGSHVLVYYNHGEGAENVLRSLKAAGTKARIYGFPDDVVAEHDPHLNMRSPSRTGFLEDLATSRAVVSTAGFTLMSEALYLGKPILAVPNGGIFEQTLNARFLAELGLGERVDQEELNADVVRGFLDRADRYRTRGSSQVDCGTRVAVDRIEEAVNDVTSRSPVS